MRPSAEFTGITAEEIHVGQRVSLRHSDGLIVLDPHGTARANYNARAGEVLVVTLEPSAAPEEVSSS